MEYFVLKHNRILNIVLKFRECLSKYHLLLFSSNLDALILIFNFFLLHKRGRQLKLQKVKATQQDIEEFKQQQAEWRRMEQEKVEAENRRIKEFASQQKQMEETRMAKIKEREQAKDHLYKMVNTFFTVQLPTQRAVYNGHPPFLF